MKSIIIYRDSDVSMVKITDEDGNLIFEGNDWDLHFNTWVDILQKHLNIDVNIYKYKYED